MYMSIPLYPDVFPLLPTKKPALAGVFDRLSEYQPRLL